MNAILKLPPGVDRNHNKFRARIVVQRKKIHLGMFTTPEAAGRAYAEAAEFYGIRVPETGTTVGPAMAYEVDVSVDRSAALRWDVGVAV